MIGVIGASAVLGLPRFAGGLMDSDETLLFCDDPTGERPLLVGTTFYGEIMVAAVYPDGRGVTVENGTPFIDIDRMRVIATHPNLLAFAT